MGGEGVGAEPEDRHREEAMKREVKAHLGSEGGGRRREGDLVFSKLERHAANGIEGEREGGEERKCNGAEVRGRIGIESEREARRMVRIEEESPRKRESRGEWKGVSVRDRGRERRGEWWGVGGKMPRKKRRGEC